MEYGREFEFRDGKIELLVPDVVFPPPDVRRLQDAKQVLLDSALLPEDTPLYYMYRGVYRKGDQDKFDNSGIRYDITILTSATIGREFVKTIGHFHPLKPDRSGTYPEYYEVLWGEALYLLQKNTPDGDVAEIMAVEARRGDKVYIPPGYGHVTVNPGPDILVMANLIAAGFRSLYEPFSQKHGAAYYCVAGQAEPRTFIRNPRYNNPVELKVVPASALSQPADLHDRDLYEAFIAAPDRFKFLV